MAVEALAAVLTKMNFKAPYPESRIQKEQKQETVDRMIESNTYQAWLLEEFDALVVSLANLPQPITFFQHKKEARGIKGRLRVLVNEDAESVGSLLHVAVSRVHCDFDFDEAKAKHVIDALIALGVSATFASAGSALMAASRSPPWV